MGKIQVVRAVIDTNVIISALLFGGTPGELIPLWKAGRIKAFTSKEMHQVFKVIGVEKNSTSTRALFM